MTNPADEDSTPPAFPDIDPPSFPGDSGSPSQIALPDWLFDAQLPDDPRIDTGSPVPPILPEALPETVMDNLPVPTMEGLPIPSTEDPQATPESQLLAAETEAIPESIDMPDFNGLSNEIDAPSLDQMAAPVASLKLPEPEPEPKPISIGSLPLAYGLVAKINLPRTANGFRVEHQLPPGVKVLEIQPPTMVVSNVVVWEFGRMESGRDLRLSLVVAPSPNSKLQAGDLTSFSVTYTQNLTFQTPLVRPRITPRIDGPTQLEVGRTATFSLNLMNTGNWPVTNVEAVVHIPDGLVHTAGNRLTHRIKRLLPGESQSLSMGLKAIRNGNVKIEAHVTAADRLQEETTFAIQLTRPILTLSMSGPEDWIVDEPANIRVLVRNIGDAPAQNLCIQAAIPDSFILNRCDGEYSEAEKMVRWVMKDMIANGSRSFELRVTPQKPLDATILAEAIADHQNVSAELNAPVRLSMARRSTILDELLAASPAPLATGFQPSTRRSNQALQQFIVFTLNQTEYAVPLDRVQEVGRPPSWTPLPNVPDWLLGVANVRGEIVSMVDLRGFFSADHVSHNRDTRMLVLQSADRNVTTAMLVDRVRGIRNLAPADIHRPTATINDAVAEYMRGVIEIAGDLVVVLDVNKILSSPKLRQFETV